MKRTKLSQAVRWGLASQVFAAGLITMPQALSQNAPSAGLPAPESVAADTAAAATSSRTQPPAYYPSQSGQPVYVNQSGHPYAVSPSGGAVQFTANYPGSLSQPQVMYQYVQSSSPAASAGPAPQFVYYVPQPVNPQTVSASAATPTGLPPLPHSGYVHQPAQSQVTGQVRAPIQPDGHYSQPSGGVPGDTSASATSGHTQVLPPNALFAQAPGAPLVSSAGAARPGAHPYQPVVVYVQAPQQFVYVESSQPGLYRRVPVQPQAPQPVYVQKPPATNPTLNSSAINPSFDPSMQRAVTAGSTLPQAPSPHVQSPSKPSTQILSPRIPSPQILSTRTPSTQIPSTPIQSIPAQSASVQIPHRQSGAEASAYQTPRITPRADAQSSLDSQAAKAPDSTLSSGTSNPAHPTRTQPAAAKTVSPQKSAKELERSRLPILTNPLLTQRGAIQARDIAIEQAKKKAAERRAAIARASTAALSTAGAYVQNAQRASQALATSAGKQVLAQTAQSMAPTVASTAPAMVQPVQAPVQPPAVRSASPGYRPVYRPDYRPVPQPAPPVSYPGTSGFVSANAPRQYLVRLPNGQLMMQTLRAPINLAANAAYGQMQAPRLMAQPIMGQLSTQGMRMAQSQVPAMTPALIQPGVPSAAVNPGQVVYPGQPPAVGTPSPGLPSFPRPPLAQPISQLVPPIAPVPPANVLTTAEKAADLAVDALASQIVAEPRPRVLQRRLTGSLTKFDDERSSQPFRSLESTDIDTSGSANIETSLNALSNVTPSSGAASNTSQGLATANLRGLGAQYTQVLLNGRPFVPADGQGVVNIDSIPLPLIQRIDTVTGGSSVAYGPGGLAGMVNFVTNDRFQGTQVDVSHQTAFDGEGGSSNAAFTFGTQFAKGRGHFAASVGASERAGVLGGERELAAFAQFDDFDQQGNPILIDGGSSGVPGTSIFAGALGDFSPTFGATFDADGSVRPFEGNSANSIGDFYNYAEVNYLRLPQRRQQAMALGSLELTQDLELYGTALVTRSDTARQLAPLPVFLSGAEFTLDDSPFFPAATQQVLSDAFGNGVDSDGDGIDDTATAFVRRRLVEAGNRRAEYESTTQFVEGGVRGRFGKLDYDLYASKGRVKEEVSRPGNISTDRFRQGLVLDLDANLDGQACRDPSPNGGPGPCVPVNIFGPGNISAAAIDWLRVDMAESSTSTQSTYGASLSANVNVPFAGQARVTLGAERRDTQYERTIITSEPVSDQQGFLFSLRDPVQGSATIDSVYGEVYLPLLSDLPGIKNLDVEAGYRLSEHSSAGQFASYRAAASWSPLDFLTVRASYNNAHQAPSIADLYTTQTESFSDDVDPCSAAAGALSPDTVAQCLAVGVPRELLGSPFLNLPNGQLRALSGGNPDLKETSAISQSLGFTLDTPVADSMRVTLSADYFQIDSDSAVGTPTGTANAVLDACFDGSFADTSQLNPFCNYVRRRSDGSLDVVELTAKNGARFSTSGIDLNASFSAALSKGVFSLDYSGTQLESTSLIAFDGADRLECDGRFGELCGEPRPTYRHSVAARYRMDNASARLAWRRIGASRDDDETQNYAVEDIEPINYIDLAFSVPVSDYADFSVGINNVTNTLPPVLGDNQGLSNTYPQTYDALGRTVFVRFSGASGLARK